MKSLILGYKMKSLLLLLPFLLCHCSSSSTDPVGNVHVTYNLDTGVIDGEGYVAIITGQITNDTLYAHDVYVLFEVKAGGIVLQTLETAGHFPPMTFRPFSSVIFTGEVEAEELVLVGFEY